MRYDLRHIAGYCSELAIWSILCDIIQQLKAPAFLSPEHVYIANDVVTVDSRLPACSEADCVWSIGTLTNYLSSGRLPFGGRGIDYHKANPDAQMPVLRQEHNRLQRLVHDCMKCDTAQTPSLDQVLNIVKAGKEACQQRASTKALQKSDTCSTNASNVADELWPEEF